MPRHHYLPAAYLGYFSSESIGKLRSRHLFSKDLESGKIFNVSANNIGCVKNLYTETIESIWNDYESGLIKAIDDLLLGKLTAITWARVLVPFVAGMLVRGPEFDERFEERLEWTKDIPNFNVNTNIARIMELQRLLAPILAAHWLVMQTSGSPNLIINDIGYIPYEDFQYNQTGYAIPITRNNLLGIIPNQNKLIAYRVAGEWYPVIKYVNLSKNNHIGFNNSSARFAHRFIYGDSEALVAKYSRSKLYETVQMPEPGQLGFIDGKMAVLHEFTWHKFVSALEGPSNSRMPPDFDFNFEVLSKGWCPPIYFPANLPGFIPGLFNDENRFYIDLYIPPDLDALL